MGVFGETIPKIWVFLGILLDLRRQKSGIILRGKHYSEDIYGFLLVVDRIKDVVFTGVNHPKSFAVSGYAFSFWKVI